MSLNKFYTVTPFVKQLQQYVILQRSKQRVLNDANVELRFSKDFDSAQAQSTISLLITL